MPLQIGRAQKHRFGPHLHAMVIYATVATSLHHRMITPQTLPVMAELTVAENFIIYISNINHKKVTCEVSSADNFSIYTVSFDSKQFQPVSMR